MQVADNILNPSYWVGVKQTIPDEIIEAYEQGKKEGKKQLLDNQKKVLIERFSDNLKKAKVVSEKLARNLKALIGITSGMIRKVKHAEHNEKACKYLAESGEFSDWVVTTAFYPAIHFVDSILFPKQYEVPNSTGKFKTYHSLDEYARDCQRRGDTSNTFHKIRIELVDEILPEISAEFRLLSDNCKTARYHNYQVSIEVANQSCITLDKIKSLCRGI